MEVNSEQLNKDDIVGSGSLVLRMDAEIKRI